MVRGRWSEGARLIGAVVLLGSTAFAVSCADNEGSDAVAANPGPAQFGGPDDVQTWSRFVGDGVRGVSVGTPGDGTWNVSVSVAEFLRADPLEAEMRSLVMQAIRGVPGVDDAYEEDREVWVVIGNPAGEELLSAVGDAVDALAPRARAEIDKL